MGVKTSASEEKIGYKDIVRQKEFMKSLVAGVVNRFGDSIDAIASAWIVYELTGTAFWSAFLFGVNYLPTVVITPFAGVWVEGRKKKNIMVVTDIIRAICVGFVATGYMLRFLKPWMLIGTTLLISTTEAFRNPAGTALTPQILEKKYYEYGLSLSSSLGRVTELIGTGLAASIIAFVGTAGAIYVDMGTFVVSALIILTVNTRERGERTVRFDRRAYGKEFKDGLSYAFSKKEAFLLCTMAIFLNAILVPLNSLQAPIIGEILNDGATALSLMGIAISVSMLVASLIYPVIRDSLNGRRIFVFCGIGIVCFYFGLVAFEPLYGNQMLRYFIFSVLCFELGFTCALASAYCNVEFLKQIDEEYLARTASFLSSASVAVMPIMSFVVSGMAGITSTKIILMVTGGISIFVTVGLVMNKTLKKLG